MAPRVHSRGMLRRVAPVLLLLASCTPDAHETTLGSVTQLSTTWRHAGAEPQTWIVLVDDAATTEAAVRRTELLTFVERTTLAVAQRPAGAWVDVDLRAIVVGASRGRVLSTDDDAALAWSERDASAVGAARFAAAIAAAAQTTSEVDAPDPVHAVDAARARLSPGEAERRNVILLGGWERSKLAAITELLHEPWEIWDADRLAERDAVFVDRGSDFSCTGRRVASCAMRVFLAEGTCAERGLVDAPALDPASPDLPHDRRVCDVPALAGEAAHTCTDSSADGRALPGGFCLVDGYGRCGQAVRVVGGARPRDGLVELVCNAE